jgi:hypothetical protein
LIFDLPPTGWSVYGRYNEGHITDGDGGWPYCGEISLFVYVGENREEGVAGGEEDEEELAQLDGFPLW